MIKLPPEEIRRLADAYWDEHYNGSKFSVVQVAGFGEVVQEAQLAKLRETKPEDLREGLAKQLFNDAWETCPEWVREYSLKKADSVLSLITPFMAVQIEAAEKAGMEKVVEFFNDYAASTDPFPERILVVGGKDRIVPCRRYRVPDPDLQAFLKENGIEAKS